LGKFEEKVEWGLPKAVAEGSTSGAPLRQLGSGADTSADRKEAIDVAESRVNTTKKRGIKVKKSAKANPIILIDTVTDPQQKQKKAKEKSGQAQNAKMGGTIARKDTRVHAEAQKSGPDLSKTRERSNEKKGHSNAF